MGNTRNRIFAGLAVAVALFGAGVLVGHGLANGPGPAIIKKVPTCTETAGDCVLEPAITPQAEQDLTPTQEKGATEPPPDSSLEPVPGSDETPVPVPPPGGSPPRGPPDAKAAAAFQFEAPTLQLVSSPSGLNGRLTSRELAPITGGVPGFPGSGQLANAPAAALNAAAVRIHDATGIWITTNGPDSAYRSLPRQQYWKDYWCSRGACQNAATVGTSNHGYGWAIDTSTQTGSLLDRFGGPFGWRRSCSDAPWEPWHWKWCGGWSGRDPGPFGKNLFQPIKRGSKGKDVGTLTARLSLLAAPGKRDHFMRWSNRGKVCGKPCVSGIRRFQRAEHLGVDGVVGPKTDARLDARWAFYKKHHRRGH